MASSTTATATSSLPPNVSDVDASSPRPPIVTTHIDFPSVGLAEYKDHYAAVVDHAFSAAECRQLVALAGDDAWQPALISLDSDTQALRTDVRRCERVMLDDEATAAWLWERVRAAVPELAEHEGVVVTLRGRRQQGVHRATRLNERLRFLRYGVGEYFKRECCEDGDGQRRGECWCWCWC